MKSRREYHVQESVLLKDLKLNKITYLGQLQLKLFSELYIDFFITNVYWI